MSDQAAARPVVTAERRVALFYFTQMMPLGAAVVYAGIWFAAKGFTSDQIGIANALPVLIMITLNLSIGRIADRASDWRKVIAVSAGFQGLCTLGFFFVDGFWGVLAVWTLCVIPNTAIAPVADAATIRLTMRNGTSFGPIRACATIGYMLAVALTGVVVGRFGGDVFVPLYVGLSMLKALSAQLLPAFRAPVRPAEPHPGARRLADVMRPWFLLPLVGQAMVFGTHIILNAFAALLWKAQGIPTSVIGPLITLGALSEALMMFAWTWLGVRVPPLPLMVFAALVSAFRWAAMGFSPPVAVLVPLQLLHAITFALNYLAWVHFIARHTSEDIAAEAQSFTVVVSQSMAVIAVVGFGWLTGSIGAHAYFVAAGFALVGAVLIWLSLQVAPRRTA